MQPEARHRGANLLSPRSCQHCHSPLPELGTASAESPSCTLPRPPGHPEISSGGVYNVSPRSTKGPAEQKPLHLALAKPQPPPHSRPDLLMPSVHSSQKDALEQKSVIMLWGPQCYHSSSSCAEQLPYLSPWLSGKLAPHCHLPHSPALATSGPLHLLFGSLDHFA